MFLQIQDNCTNHLTELLSQRSMSASWFSKIADFVNLFPIFSRLEDRLFPIKTYLLQGLLCDTSFVALQGNKNCMSHSKPCNTCIMYMHYSTHKTRDQQFVIYDQPVKNIKDFDNFRGGGGEFQENWVFCTFPK